MNPADYNILLVDDEQDILEFVGYNLQKEGYNVAKASSGVEAIAKAKKVVPHLILLDVMMPEMDGIDVVKAVKHVRPDIDVIMITGYATIESAVDAMKYGAMDYVQKPFTADELIAFASQALIRRQARIEKERRRRFFVVHIIFDK